MNIRHLRTRCLLAVSCILALLVAGEGALRLFPSMLPAQLRRTIHAYPQSSSVSHPYIGHLNKPDRFTDPHGFRNDWPWPEAPEIITLGDSVTFGTGVEAAATWPAVLARTYPEHAVVNLAVGATGPQQYQRVFETFGVGLRAKLVLIGFFAQNDFWDAALFDKWLKSGAGGNYLAWRDFGRPADVRLTLQQPTRKLAESALWRTELAARKTSLGNLLLHAAGRSRPWVPSEAGMEVYEAPDGTRLKLRPEDLRKRARLADPGSEVLPRVLAALERIQLLAHQNGGNALVIFLPSREEVYLPFMGTSVPDPAAPLRAALEERGVPYLDLLEDFRGAAAAGDSLFLGTGRPLLSAGGHALIARLVISQLRARATDYGLTRRGLFTATEYHSASR